MIAPVSSARRRFCLDRFLNKAWPFLHGVLAVRPRMLDQSVASDRRRRTEMLRPTATSLSVGSEA